MHPKRMWPTRLLPGKENLPDSMETSLATEAEPEESVEELEVVASSAGLPRRLLAWVPELGGG